MTKLNVNTGVRFSLYRRHDSGLCFSSVRASNGASGKAKSLGRGEMLWDRDKEDKPTRTQTEVLYVETAL
jgi:hypothetical protein